MDAIIDKIAEYRKAIAAFLVPPLSLLAIYIVDGIVTPEEWLNIAIIALTGTTAVAAIPNEVNPKHIKDPAALAAALVSEENRRLRHDGVIVD